MISRTGKFVSSVATAAAVLVLMLACAPSHVTRADAYTLNIATFLYQNCSTSQKILDPNITIAAVGADATQASFLRGYKLWRDSVNALGGLTLFGNITVTVNVTFFCPGPMTSAGSDAGIVTAAGNLLTAITTGVYGNYPVIIANPIASPNMNVKLAGICDTTKACVFIHPLSATTSLFVCGGSNTPNPIECTSKSRRIGARRFDYAWTTFPAEGQTFTPFANLLANKGLKSLVYLSSPNDAFAPATSAVSVATVQSLGIEVKLNMFLQNGWTQDQYVSFVQNITENYPAQAIAMNIGSAASNLPMCAGMLKAMKANNWMPAAAYIGACEGTAYTDPEVMAGDLTKYWFTTSPWDERLRGQQFRVFNQLGSLEPFAATDVDDSPQVFARMMRTRYPTVVFTPTTMAFGALGAFACMMAQKALEVNPVLPPNANDIAFGLRSLSQPSHFGTMQFDQWGRLVPVTFTFYQTGDALTLNLQSPIPGGVDSIVPIPAWDERVFTRTSLYESTAEYVVLALTTLCIAYAGVLLVFFLYHRKNGVILAATPVFCAFTLLGSMVLMSANYTWTNHENSYTCASKVWLLQLGFSLLFSSMLIKTLRIWAIFQIQKLQVVRISTTFLVGWLMAFIGFETVFTLIWQLIDPYHVVEVTVDPLRPAMNYTVCGNTDTNNNWIVAALVIKFALMGISAWASFAVRKVPSEFQESTFVGASIWNVTFLMVIGVSVVITSSDRVFSFYVRTLGNLLMCTSTISLIFLPKIIRLREGEGQVQAFYRDKNQAGTAIGTKVDTEGEDNTPANKRSGQHHSGINMTPQLPAPPSLGAASSGGNNPVQRAYMARLQRAEHLVQRIKNHFPDVANHPDFISDFNFVLAVPPSTDPMPSGTPLNLRNPRLGRDVSDGGGPGSHRPSGGMDRRPSSGQLPSTQPRGTNMNGGAVAINIGGANTTSTDPNGSARGGGSARGSRASPRDARVGYKIVQQSSNANNNSGISNGSPHANAGQNTNTNTNATGASPATVGTSLAGPSPVGGPNATAGSGAGAGSVAAASASPALVVASIESPSAADASNLPGLITSNNSNAAPAP